MSTQVSLHQQISNYIHNQFSNYITQTNSHVNWQWKMFDDNTLINGITERLFHGTDDDVKRYISDNFSNLNYGLKYQLFTDLINIYKAFVKNGEVLSKPVEKPPKKYDIVDSWRYGKITPINLFSDIFNAIKSNTIDKISGNEKIQTVLNESGYSKCNYINNPNIIKHRKRIDMPNLQLFDVLSVYGDYEEPMINVVTNGLIFKIYNQSLHNYEVLQSNESLRLPVSNINMYYQHVGNFSGVKIVNPKLNNYSNIMNPVLLIGDNISYLDLKIEIHDVISVDSIHINNQSNWITSVILVKGFGLDSNEIKQSDLIDDTKTEVGENAVDENLNSSGGSNEDYIDNAIHLPAVISLRKRYYVINVHIVNLEHVIVDSLVPVQAKIDQLPTTIQLLTYEGDSVMYGSNGLLTVIKLNDFFHNSFTVDASINATSNFEVISLDTISNTFMEYHAIDSVITKVSYNNNFLVSGDNTGMICLWQIYPSALRSTNESASSNNDKFIVTLHDSLLCFVKPFNNRVVDVLLSPSNNHIVVTYIDRLIILGIRKNDNSYNLYTKSILDIVEGYRAVYNTKFEENGIVIWRLMNGHVTKRRSPREITSNSVAYDSISDINNNPGLIITTWTHLNIDLFDIQHPEVYISECDDKVTLTNTVSPPKSPDNSVMNIDNKLSDRQDSNKRLNHFEFTERESTPQFTRDISTNNNQESYIVPYYLPIVIIDSYNKYEYVNANDVNLPVVYCPIRYQNDYDTNHSYMEFMTRYYVYDTSDSFQIVKPVLAVYAAISIYQTVNLGLLSSALDKDASYIIDLINNSYLKQVFNLANKTNTSTADYIYINEPFNKFILWLTSKEINRIGKEFWIDIAIGHNYMCALHLRYCGNKSVAVESPWQDYLRAYGPMHLRNTSRKLKDLTSNIRKLDETSGIKDTLPGQIGYISGLQEFYARRVGLYGRIPDELGELSNLRVLSMGNNRLCGELPKSLGKLKKLQRIVLHQNCLSGEVPKELGKLGCIVNLAGNTGLEHGEEVPNDERDALVDIYLSTSGHNWFNKLNWLSSEPVAKWYKVGVLTSHVHSIVMSSNGMNGVLPSSMGKLKELRMIELATMAELVGPLPKELFSITTIRRLCICRCGLTGSLPDEIGQLIALEELQLFGNHLTGQIPDSLGNLKDLKLLSLGEYTGGNDFAKGPLPPCLSKLTSLEALFMANCNITGPIPSWISDLIELRQLDLQRNYLSGVLPNSIGKLSNLLYLNLKDNEQLSGKLPVLSMSQLNKLNRLSLVHCNFEDTDRSIPQLQSHLPRCKIWI